MYYSPYDPGTYADPYPIYARLRAESPVYRNDDLDFWALSRHADVWAAFADMKRLSNINGNSIEPTSWGPNAFRYASILAMDPPGHTRVRGRIGRFFSTRGVGVLEPFIRTTIRGLLKNIGSKPEFDFIKDFTEKFPGRVLSALAGIQEEDIDEVCHLIEIIVDRPQGNHDIPPEAIKATLAMMEYFRRAIADRHNEQRDDLISGLLAGPPGNSPADRRSATDEEIVALLNLIMSAGTDTVIGLVGNAWYWAWRNPDQRRLALAGNIDGWVEETLRYDTPSQLAARTVVEDIELHDVVIPAGGRLLLLPGSANRDAMVFPDPDRYDLTRNSFRKVSFGGGRHICLGSRLARLQARVALEELTSVIADYDIDEAGVRWVTSAEARAFASLPTTVRFRRQAKVSPSGRQPRK